MVIADALGSDSKSLLEHCVVPMFVVVRFGQCRLAILLHTVPSLTSRQLPAVDR